MAYEFWETKIEDNIFWAYINRVNKKNAFNVQLCEELYQICLEVEKNKNIRYLVIGSKMDEIFCSGADIEWFYGLGEEDGRHASIRAQEVFRKLELLPIPVIAAVKGLNLTAGFELMLCCDLIIGASNAQFGQIETKYGLTPGGGGTQRLTRVVGPLKAREMIYMAKVINAEEALKIGLINEVVPLEKLEARIKEICAQMSKNSQAAIKEAKFLIDLATYTNHQGFIQENRMFGQEFGSGEPRKRFEKFVQKSGEKK